MKKTFTVVLALCALLGFAQNDDLGRVKKINGVEAYVMCEPLRDYEVVVDIHTGLKAESLLTGGLVNKSISGRMEQFIRRVKKENEAVEAVVYTSGKRIVGVRFKDEATAENKGLARVTKMKGKPVFVMCEPVQKYTMLKSKGGGIKWKSLVTAGLANNSIEDDVEKIVEKLDKVKGLDAFYFDGTKEGEAIGFE